jgi:AcrR family transcriptional regulator
MKNKTSRSPGRPRMFEREDALDRAVIAFWAKGYSGTTLDDLTESMGINRPSLYASFGGKHDLYMEAIDRYAMTYGCQPVKALQSETDIKKSVAAFLDASIRCVTSKDGPKGCLISTVAADDAEKDSQVRDKINSIFTETDRVIADHFKAAQRSGQLFEGASPDSLARMTFSITHSFAARARVGASRKELSHLAKALMAVLFPASN